MSLLRSLRWRALVAAWVLCPFAAGCSFLFVSGPTTETRRSPQVQTCTTGTLAPGLDVALTGWQVVRTLIAVGRTDEDYRGTGFSRPADITFGILFTTLALSSAIYGFNATDEGREGVGMESARVPRTRPHSRDVAAEIAEDEAAQARAAARAAEQARAAGEAAQASTPGAR